MVVAIFIVGWAIWYSNVRPLLADLHSWRGTQALAQGNVAMAVDEYETAVYHQPQRAAYLATLALTTAQTGDVEQAERTMQQAITLRPTDPLLYTQLATIYEQKSVEDAYHAYEQAIALAPTIGLTHQQYADFALRTSDNATALTQAQRATQLDATDGIAFGILGWAQLQDGNLAAAQQAFEQAIKWQPDSADFQLGLATVYYQQGNLNAAQRAVQNSLARAPNYAPALTLQQQLQRE